MKEFLDREFLLQNNAAVELYEKYSAVWPLVDYHCHLNPADIAADRIFSNLTEAWLQGDHYKWRAMRTNGIDERYITGEATPVEKFIKWAETVPYTLRNPLYHWTHLELRRYFGITGILGPSSARDIYEEASEKLRSPDFSVRNLLLKMNAEVVCTTDDPADTLEHHQKIAADPFGVKVIPAWRPDRAMAVEHVTAYNGYLNRLGEVAGKEIQTFDDLVDILAGRHQYFHDNGCRLSDHGLDGFYARDYNMSEIRSIFGKVRHGSELDAGDIRSFKSAMLYLLAVMDHEKGWVQQFHVGAARNNNQRMFGKVGPDTGFDSVGEPTGQRRMAKFFSRLDAEGKLAKTIVYNLNPSDNEMYATMTGNFQDGSIPGKIQWGSAWWFLDQKRGIENHLETLSALGLLSRFVGMLTDSRSFLSFPRHEYFRRILCNLVGRDMENGEIPMDYDLAGELVSGVSYRNARNYFSFWE